MSYTLDILDLPPELQRPMIRLIESFRQSLHAELAVRREDFDRLSDAVVELAEAQKRTEQRLDRLEAIVAELIEAQKRTEQRVAELAEAQKRTEERLDRLEAVVAELIEAQKRTEQRLDRLEAVVAELIEAQKRTEQRVAELAEAQKRTEQRVDRLEAIVAELIEAQKRTEQRVAELAEAQKRTEQILQGLIGRVDRMDEKLGRLVGESLERRYRERAFAYFGPIMRRIRVVSLQDVVADIEDRLTEAELNDLLPLDVLVRGQVQQLAQKPEVWLAIEVSAVVDRSDVERARRRAGLLRKAGLTTIPVAAGEEVTEGARQLAQRENVMLLQDGQRLFWDEALADAVTA